MVPGDDGFQEEEGVPEASCEDEDEPNDREQGQETVKYKKPTFLWQQDNGKYSVCMRQQLKNDEVFDAFEKELQATIDQLKWKVRR